MTFQALNTAISGLRAAQQQLSTISNNVTNATTEGYNRQIVPQKTQVLRETGTTVGVLTQAAIRQVDMNLQRDLWTQVSASSMQDVQVEYLQQIQSFNGPPDQGFSIAAQIADLRDSFSALSDIPDDIQSLEATVNQATIVADKFNDYASLLTQMRNDAQNDLQTTVNTVNGLLEEIANINNNLQGAKHIGSSVAGLQDQRDIAIKELTETMDISFFERADGVLVVQTREGQELAGDVAHSLQFESQPISANQYYPQSASGLILINETNAGYQTKIDLTERVVGGSLGGLIELRDEKIPTYQAQIDELAFQMAHRFDQQGLKLFTDQNGFVPENTAPDPDTLPLPTPVTYVDFARVIEVNRQITNDPTLLQTGTYNSDVTTPSGDNSVIHRVLEFGFGEVNYQEAVGTIDLTAGGTNPDLQTLLGLSSSNTVVLGTDFSAFPQVFDGIDGTNDLIETFQDDFLDFDPLGDNDQFRITLGGADLVIDLTDVSTNFPLGDPQIRSDGTGFVATGTINNALDQIISAINTAAGAAGLDAASDFVTSNNYGQLVIQSAGDIEVSRFTDSTETALLGEAMSEPAIEALGIQTGTFATEHPNFTVQVGNNDPYTIEIAPGDTVTELMDKLTWSSVNETGVPGLFVDLDPTTGGLILRPGIDNDNWVPPQPFPTTPIDYENNHRYGGGITVTSGSFTTSGATDPTIIDTVNVTSALFGSFTGTGTTLAENSPVANVSYESETFDASDSFKNFRNDNLGPNASISTGIFSSTSLIDYAQKVVDETAQDYQQVQNSFDNEDTLRGILQRQFSDDSGVNIDEEMSHLIVVQTAYAAAARTISAADEMFQELLDSIR